MYVCVCVMTRVQCFIVAWPRGDSSQKDGACMFQKPPVYEMEFQRQHISLSLSLSPKKIPGVYVSETTFNLSRISNVDESFSLSFSLKKGGLCMFQELPAYEVKF